MSTVQEGASMSVDFIAIVREFGLGAVIVLAITWIVVSFCKSVFPPIGAACGRLVDAWTEEVKARTEESRVSGKAIKEIPNVLAQNNKEYLEALSLIKEALMGSESRIREDVRASKEEVKDAIHDDRHDKIDKNLEKIAKRTAVLSREPDTDPAASPPKK